ncbi:NAD(P)/FAD-dependent oxidoreductase [Aquipuribacter nitratireducens]|uniref:NAD(P)/FAD-dependent oxidoreductase n=1 Tax=Aquipuribacter nitratireducens TaxID=650104 RepID=A0ABW0GLK1_9MICO
MTDQMVPGPEVSDGLDESYDVVVVGGGSAGLSAGLMLGRALRRVAVVDAGAPRNAPAHEVHGLLGRDGTPPAELLARGRSEVRRYGGHVVVGTVGQVSGTDGAFTVDLADGRTTLARKLLVTTGLADELPDVAGLRERWGRDVLHCPYCHGWEVRGQAIGVVASGPMALHQVLLFRQWSDDVTLFTHTQDAPSPEDAERLAARGIGVVEGRVASVEVRDDRVTGLRLADGTLVAREAVVVGTYMRARADLLGALGLEAVPHPSGTGEHVPADPVGRTAVPGVSVAGNVTDLTAQVGAAAAAGAMAAAVLNADLVTEETATAVQAARTSRVA